MPEGGGEGLLRRMGRCDEVQGGVVLEHRKEAFHGREKETDRRADSRRPWDFTKKVTATNDWPRCST